jgi:hypothetical protein
VTQAVAPDSLAGLVGMAGPLPLSEDGGDAFRGHAVQVQMKLGDPLELGSRLGAAAERPAPRSGAGLRRGRRPDGGSGATATL